MKLIKKLLFFAIKISLIGMLVLTGSSAINNLEEQQTPQPKEVQITEDGLACGSGTELNVSDTLVLILNGNPSTGYTWDVGFYVHPVIEPLGEPGINLTQTCSEPLVRTPSDFLQSVKNRPH